MDSFAPLEAPHPPSCRTCRLRKVKCDRRRPCSNCCKAGRENDCTYPAGVGRAPKRPRRAPDPHLINRLARLESTIRDLKAPGTPIDHGLRNNASRSASGRDTPSDINRAEQQLGRLVVDEKKSYYVSNVMWANLGDQIEELRNMLADDVSDDDDDETDNNYSTSQSHTEQESNAALIGYRPLSRSLRGYHPSLSQSVRLLQVFSANVAPLVHAFHLPSTISTFWESVASPDTVDKNTEALMFAIYYSAVVSMSAELCGKTLGSSRAALLARYRFGFEQASAFANLLNTQSMRLLQAFVIFLSALRHEDDTRAPWSLTALIFHIAQSMGLHRDGQTFGLKPFETELRRRLWWHICLLDSRSSEYHGCEPIVRDHMFDTRLPLHINDADITPEMTEPPEERTTACEMTFCLIRCEAMRVCWKVNYVPASVTSPANVNEGPPLKERQAAVEVLRGHLETRYLQHCDDRVPLLRLSSLVARLIIQRAWLSVHFPLRGGIGAERDSEFKDQLFSTSINVLAIASQLLEDGEISHWSWHSRTHIQWHAVTFVLFEICTRPKSAECDRAWELVHKIQEQWNRNGNGRNGILSKPISRLMAKASYVRELQDLDAKKQSRKAALVSNISAVSTPQFFGGDLGPCGFWNGDLMSQQAIPNLPNPFDTAPFDSLSGGFSDDFGTDLFGAAYGGNEHYFMQTPAHDVFEGGEDLTMPYPG